MVPFECGKGLSVQLTRPVLIEQSEAVPGVMKGSKGCGQAIGSSAGRQRVGGLLEFQWVAEAGAPYRAIQRLDLRPRYTRKRRCGSVVACSSRLLAFPISLHAGQHIATDRRRP